MIIDHGPIENVDESNFVNEQELDRIYHIIPDWIHRDFPGKPLNEKVRLGFEKIQNHWTKTFLDEVRRHTEIKEFAIYVCKKHNLKWEGEYWEFLTSKDKNENV